jgi:hypothetical protein
MKPRQDLIGKMKLEINKNVNKQLKRKKNSKLLLHFCHVKILFQKQKNRLTKTLTKDQVIGLDLNSLIDKVIGRV